MYLNEEEFIQNKIRENPEEEKSILTVRDMTFYEFISKLKNTKITDSYLRYYLNIDPKFIHRRAINYLAGSMTVGSILSCYQTFSNNLPTNEAVIHATSLFLASESATICIGASFLALYLSIKYAIRKLEKSGLQEKNPKLYYEIVDGLNEIYKTKDLFIQDESPSGLKMTN